jgi:hypothetical protein
MKIYFEDLDEGTVFRGDECVADKNEMLEYARKNDPLPFHVDEEATRNSLWWPHRQCRVHGDSMESVNHSDPRFNRVSWRVRVACQTAPACTPRRPTAY